MSKLPSPLPTSESLDLPETLGYRIKNKLLGHPINSSNLDSERLGNFAALGVLAPDCISSSAYASEQILTILVPVVGVVAFSLVLPITAAIIGVLILVTLSYREVVQVYTKAGGSYVVARENFGPNIAQISAVALLIDYTVTVAVQTAAGTVALVSLAPSTIAPYQTPISVAVVVFLCYGNLRGIREASKVFAFPTYLFVLGLGSVIVIGLIRVALGDLPVLPTHVHGALSLLPGNRGRTSLFEGAGIFYILQAYANGGSALTGLEAISDGVSAFRPPEGINARRVLVAMSTTLGSLVVGVSLLAHFTHAIPYISGAPSVVSQEAKEIFGGGAGAVPYYAFQMITLLILWTGANTSFNGFPYLANFVAGDSFLPRQLTKRGHRLAFSNGIIVLAVVAIALLVATGANLNALIAFYAIGVFTGFTMAGAGMFKYHIDHHQPGWKLKSVINGSAAVVTAAVVLIFAVTKFTSGAWVVVVAFPLLLWALIRLNRQYRQEEEMLEEGATAAAEAPALRRLVVLVFIDHLDLAAAQAIRYARALRPNEIRAVHFVLDDVVAAELRQTWTHLGLPEDIGLYLRNCPSRRLLRDALELVAETVAEEGTEVSVLLPRRVYARAWSRLLHDRTADHLASQISRLPHANATVVPFLVAASPLIAGHAQRVEGAPTAAAPTAAAPEVAEPEVAEPTAAEPEVAETPAPEVADPARPKPGPEPARREVAEPEDSSGDDEPSLPAIPGTIPVAEVRWRQRAKVVGRVKAVQVQPLADTPRVTMTLMDSTGGLLLVFGRRQVAGVSPGTRLVAEGMVSQLNGHLAIFNPHLSLLADTEETGSGGDQAEDE
ncbi:MAG: amino acid permease [Acidimicrobiales bacterium]